MRRALLLPLVVLTACSRHEPPPPEAKEALTTLSAAIPAGADAHDGGAAGTASPSVVAQGRSLAGKKVLHVGDSMVGGTFGLTRAFEAKLKTEGATIVRHTTVSESLSSFDKSPTLKDLIRTHEPDIIVITLGANDANVPHPEVYVQSIENIVHRVGDRECWWIGPPSIKNVEGSARPSANMSVVNVLKEHTGKCRFFDSSKLELERASDGIHPNDRGASKWADAFWDAFLAPHS